MLLGVTILRLLSRSLWQKQVAHVGVRDHSSHSMVKGALGLRALALSGG